MTAEQQKAELRRKAAALPKAHCPHLLQRFLELPQVQNSHTVMVFYGVKLEPDTDGLIRALLQQGKRVVLPVCLPDRRMEARAITSVEELKPNRYGIPEPDSLCPTVSREEIGAVLVPNQLCDRDGYRLGYGGGYYDRWLVGYRGFTAAVCPAPRLVDRLPRDPYDIPVDLILCDG